MQYTYTYNQSSFTNTILVNINELQSKISALNYTSGTIHHIDINGTDSSAVYSIYFSASLSSADKSSLDTLIANYNYILLPDTSCLIKDVKPAGTNGGTFISNTWVTRTLNTITGLLNFATIANNQITLKPGTYTIRVTAPSCNVQSNRIRLRNITDSTYTVGSTLYSVSDSITYGDITAYLTVTYNSIFDIQHICALTVYNIGFGRATTGITIPSTQATAVSTPSTQVNSIYTAPATYNTSYTTDGFNLDEIYTKVFITKFS